ncbi:MAG: CPBP family glutamic-type intramembrane protease [Actinomycetota bacterium]|nr:CPBP family glutamic-type intramembrane protease [Actinomycetota bacterium]
MSTQPPGWYPDPWQPKGLRYWDGSAYTSDVALPTKGPHRTLPIQVAFGALLAMAVPLVLSRFVLRALVGQRWPIAVYVVLLGLLAYGPPIMFCRYATRRWGSGRLRDDIGLSIRRVDAGWGPVTWLACVLGQVIVASIVLAAKIPFQNNTDQIRAARDNPGYVVPLLVLAVVAAPLVEEIVFRGLVLRGFLSRMGPVVAVALQAVLFGAAHFDPERGVRNLGLVLVLSAVGAVLGGAAYLFRRLAPGIIAHAVLNGVAMAIVLSGWTPGQQ